MPTQNKNQNVVITGASSGIGEALAKHYAKSGAQLGLIARRSDLLMRLQNEVVALGAPKPWIYPLDIRDREDLKNAASDFIIKCGTPDIVIANAGVSRGTRLQLKMT